MYKVSPSKLEIFRKYYCESMNGYFTKDMIIDNIKGIKTKSFKADIGNAIHAVLELGYERYYDTSTGLLNIPVKSNLISISKNLMHPVIDYYNTHLNSVNEIPIQYEIKIYGVTFILSMRIDAMLGICVVDHKTSERAFKIEDYESSLQWKIYLLATKAKVFSYNYFKYTLDEKNNINNLERNEWHLYPYPDMERDVHNWCMTFLEFCKINNLTNYIKIK